MKIVIVLIILFPSFVYGQEKMDSAKTMDNRGQYELPTQCRSDLQYSGNQFLSPIQHGYIGKFQDKRLFFEVWEIEGSVGTASNYILLRTDTTDLDSFDICLPKAGEANNRDTVLFKNAAFNGAFYYDSTLTENNFPTLFQILLYGDYGYQNYYDLNKDNDQKMYLKGNSLFIKHWDSPRYDDALLLLDRYDYNGKRFKKRSTKTLKRIKWGD
jgi:hypothetical protein